MASADALIVRVICSYHPSWEPPRDSGKEWISCKCPFHGDSRPSAAVSFTNDAFKCFVCDATGDAIGIIMREEEISYSQAIEHAESVSPGSSKKLLDGHGGKPGRRVFGGQGSPGGGRGESVPPRVRRRPFAGT